MNLNNEVFKILLKAIVIENGGEFFISDESLAKAHGEFDHKVDIKHDDKGATMTLKELDPEEAIIGLINTAMVMTAASERKGGKK